jgi:sugar/nucleoside kinase (ribokinase family)
VRLVTPLGDDPAGRVLRDQLEAESMDVAALPAPRTSVVVVLLGPSGERTMLSDRVSIDGGIATALRGCDWVHISGYPLRDPVEGDRVVMGVRSAGVEHVSVGGGSFEGWADAAVAGEAIGESEACLIIVNREEAGLLAGKPMRSSEQAAAALADPQRLAVVTDGERGSAAAGARIGRTLVQGAATTRRPSVDTTGAGDAFTASLLVSLAPSWPPGAEAVAAALERAAVAGAAATTAIGAQSVAHPDPAGNGE